MQAQDVREASATYPTTQPLYEDDVFVANPGSPAMPSCLVSSMPNTPARPGESFAEFDNMMANIFSAPLQQTELTMPPTTPTPHNEQSNVEVSTTSPLAPPYSPVETSAVRALATMHSGATSSTRKRTIDTFSNDGDTVVAQGSVTTIAIANDDNDNDDDDDDSESEAFTKELARSAPKKRSRKNYKLPQPVQRLCATDEERARLVAASTWPLRDVSLRGNLLPNAKLLLWALRPQIFSIPEIVGMTMVQHKELATKGLAAAGIPDVVIEHYRRYELRYLVAVPDGQYIVVDANFRIEATMLDHSFFWTCKQGAKRQLLLKKWGGTQQSCSGVFTALSSVARHLYAESQVLSRGALEPTLLANLDSTRFTVPGKSPKFDSALGLPRQGRSFRKLIVEVVPAALETSVAALAPLTEDITCLEQSVPAGASGPLVAVKHFVNNTTSTTSTTTTTTTTTQAAKKRRVKMPIASAKTASSAQTSSLATNDNNMIQQRLLNMQSVATASNHDDEQLASAMLAPSVSIDDILAGKHK